jgi:hypothetical protein
MTANLKRALQTISMLGLALSILPAVLVFAGSLTKETYFNLIVLGMVLWFGTAVFWIKPDHFGQ